MTMMLNRRRIIVLDGPDMCGKTQIGKRLAKETGFVYFKNDMERGAFGSASAEEYFTNTLKYGLGYFLSFLRQAPDVSVIFDRCYPTEWVYAKAFSRKTDWECLLHTDMEFTRLRADMIFTRRKSYEGIVDDTHPHLIDSARLAQLDGLYAQFSDVWTSVRNKTIWVDDEDLDREMREIYDYLKATE